jgi:hypothetical protein
MAKVTLLFEDIGLEGDARVSFDSDPDLDLVDGDPGIMTSAQLLAHKAVLYLKNIDSEEFSGVAESEQH